MVKVIVSPTSCYTVPPQFAYRNPCFMFFHVSATLHHKEENMSYVLCHESCRVCVGYF